MWPAPGTRTDSSTAVAELTSGCRSSLTSSEAAPSTGRRARCSDHLVGDAPGLAQVAAAGEGVLDVALGVDPGDDRPLLDHAGQVAFGPLHRDACQVGQVGRAERVRRLEQHSQHELFECPEIHLVQDITPIPARPVRAARLRGWPSPLPGADPDQAVTGQVQGDPGGRGRREQRMDADAERQG